MISSVMEIKIRSHFEKFLSSRMKSIENLSANDLEINPFLIGLLKNQLGFVTQYDIAKWLVNQRIERGIVTGFGKTLQNIAKEFSYEKPLPGLTMKLKKNDLIYNLMIKSGPNPYPMQPAIDMQKILLNTKLVEPKSIPVFCMCYGNEDAISEIVKKYMTDVDILIGKDFWEFLSDDPNCQKKILQIAGDLDNNYKDKKGNTVKEISKRKIEYVEEELKKLFGADEKIFWKKILEDVY